MGKFGKPYMPNGDLFSCRRLPIVVGNIFTDEIERDVRKYFGVNYCL